jgi:hypothetical protein
VEPNQREKERRRSARWRAENPEKYRESHAEARRKFTADGRPKVYFIQVPSGPIKIGFTTKRMAGRMQELQAGNHEELTLLKATLGSRAEEKALHDYFRQTRIRGEWFRPTTELLEFIAELPELPPLELPM